MLPHTPYYVCNILWSIIPKSETKHHGVKFHLNTISIWQEGRVKCYTDLVKSFVREPVENKRRTLNQYVLPRKESKI